MSTFNPKKVFSNLVSAKNGAAKGKKAVWRKPPPSSPYDKNASQQNKKTVARIDAKFTALQTRPLPKKARPSQPQKKSPSSLNIFQQRIYPLRQANIFKDKTAASPPKAQWTFFRGDLVRVVAGPFAGQSGRVAQFFKGRNTVVVHGVSSFRTDCQRLLGDPSKTGRQPLGITDVDAPIPSENLRHIGLEAAVFELVSPNPVAPQSLTAALKRELRLCAFCAELRVRPAGPRNSFLATLLPPAAECTTDHSAQRRLSDLAPGRRFAVGADEAEIARAEALSAPESEVALVAAHVPQVPFGEGQRVISMLSDSFGEKGVVAEAFLNEVYVRFDRGGAAEGPFKCFLFKAYSEAHGIEENAHASTYRRRVFEVGRRALFRYSGVPYWTRTVTRGAMDAILDFSKSCAALNTRAEEAMEVTYDPKRSN